MSEASDSAGDGISIERDPVASHARKQAILRRLHVFIIPTLRIGGYIALLTFAYWDCLMQGRPWGSEVVSSIGVYCGLSWLLLALFYGRTASLDLGLAFMMADVFPFCYIVMVTGAEKSWLTLILLVRVADQVVFGFWRSVAVTL